MSLVLHSAVAIALVGSLSSFETGAIQTPTDAISVEIVASTLLEQATVGETDKAAALPAATALNDGAAFESLAASDAAEAVTATDVASEVVSSSPAEASERTETVISGSGPEAQFETMRPPDVQRPKVSEAKAQHVKERPEKLIPSRTRDSLLRRRRRVAFARVGRQTLRERTRLGQRGHYGRLRGARGV